MSKNAGGVLASDLSIGALAMGAETTVADLANALIACNDGTPGGDPGNVN